LATTAAPPTLQFEGLVKILFADQGDEGTNEAVLADVGAWAREARATAVGRAQGYVDGDYIEGVDLGARAVILAQTLGFLAELYDLVARWSSWASSVAGSIDGAERARQVFTTIAAGGRVVP
jgi:hypothetical protein